MCFSSPRAWFGLALALVFVTGCARRRTLATEVEKGDQVLRAYLDSTSVDIDATDMYGEAAIHIAALRCDAPVITVLAAHHARVGALDGRGRTALGIASDLACTEAVYALLVAGADPNQPLHPEQVRPLELAASRGALPVVELLVRAGADVNAPNAWGQTPLHFATRGPWGYAELVTSLLLSRGAALETADVQGFTALHAAAAHENPELVAQLIARGADAGARTKMGSTPLDVALDVHADLVAELLFAMNAPQTRGNVLPPLHQAAAADDVYWALRLLSNGADPGIVAGGKTALAVAHANGSERVEALLMDQRRSPLPPSLVPHR
jgi:ankyrin repeat protein